MFTGLIESLGRIEAVVPAGSGRRLRVHTTLAPELVVGDSLAVNGVCLTIAAVEGSVVASDLGPETLRVTTLGGARPGQPVNLERAMRADARFGGHFVQGHVDGVGQVRAAWAEADAHWLTVAFDEALAPYCILKGAVAVDGISLTIAALRDREFDVMIIPFTWQETNLHTLGAGDPVNLECDMVGKYVARAAQLALTRS